MLSALFCAFRKSTLAMNHDYYVATRVEVGVQFLFFTRLGN